MSIVITYWERRKLNEPEKWLHKWKMEYVILIEGKWKYRIEYLFAQEKVPTATVFKRWDRKHINNTVKAVKLTYTYMK